MAAISHTTRSAAPDSGDGKISSNAWNENHTLTGTANYLLGFDASGNAIDIDPSTIVSSLTWGSVTGTLSDQTDLQAALDAKADNATTLAGYGITDALTTSYVPAWASISGKPTTLSGYGITDAYSSSGGTVSGSIVATGTVTGSNLSGTNTGDQTITLTGDVTGTGTGSFAATIANGAVTLAKMANMATASLIYRKTAGSGAPEVNTLATLKTDLGLTGTNSGDQTITLTGDVTGSGTASFAATIGNAKVTYAKIQNVSATSQILGRKTAGAGSPEECTLSDILDFVGSATQGDILYRAASQWQRLPAGTSGYFLKTGGSGANPSWATVGGGNGSWVVAASWSHTTDVSTVSFTGLGGFSSLIFIAVGVTKSVSGTLRLNLSTDGSTYDATSGNYVSIDTTGTPSSFAGIALHGTNATAARDGIIFMHGSNVNGAPKPIHDPTSPTNPMIYTGSNSPILAAQVQLPNGGNLTGGSIYVLGM